MSDSKYSRFAGALAGLLVFLTFLYITTSVPFPHASFRSTELLPIKPGGDLGYWQSLFLWDFRGFDILMAGLLLVTTAVSCLAMLREEKH